MRRNLTIASASALVLLVACSGGGPALESLGPPPEASPTGNAPPVAPSSAPVTGPIVTGPTGGTITGGTGSLPTTSPGATGSVTQGNASLTVSGGLQTSQPTLPLASPVVYAPAPGSFTLAWSTAGAGFALGGPTFVGTQVTSASLRLSFSIRSASGTASFSSTDGGCDVTVTTAETDSFSGTFSCLGVTDTSGATTVDATGTFNATE